MKPSGAITPTTSPASSRRFTSSIIATSAAPGGNALHQYQPRSRRIMPHTHPRRRSRLARLTLLEFRPKLHIAPAHRAKLLQRDHPRPINHALPLPHIHHRRLHPVRCLSAIQNRVDPAVQILGHVVRACRADPSKPVRARRRHRHLRCHQQRMRHRMRRHPRSHLLQPRRHQLRHFGMLRKQQRQRSRPERIHQPPRILTHFRRHLLQHRCLADMHNQRIPARPLLRRKNPPYCLGIQRIRPQPIDRLRRKRHRPARPQNLRRARNRGSRSPALRIAGFHREPQRLHSLPLPMPILTVAGPWPVFR